MPFFEFTVPSSIHFGQNAIAGIGKAVRAYASRALILTSKDYSQSQGALSTIVNALEEELVNVVIIDTVTEESDAAFADSLAHRVRMEDCGAIIALGKSGVIEIAKAAGTVYANGEETADYLDGKATPTKPSLPVIAAPSQVGLFSGITTGFCVRDAFEDTFREAFSKNIYAAETFVDPSVLMQDDRNVLFASAWTVFGAAFEIYTSRYINVISNTLALRAMETVAQNMKNVIEGEDYADAVAGIATANIIAGIAANGSMRGALHAFALSMKSAAGVEYETASAIMLPSIMEYNLTSVATKFVQIVRLFGENVKDITVLEAAIKSVENVRRILSDFGFPERLSSVGVDESMFKTIAQNALSFQELNSIPRAMGYDDIITLLEQTL